MDYPVGIKNVSPKCRLRNGDQRGISSQRLKYHDRLIGARDNRFGDSDQFVLLVEDAEARRARLAAIELRC